MRGPVDHHTPTLVKRWEEGKYSGNTTKGIEKNNEFDKDTKEVMINKIQAEAVHEVFTALRHRIAQDQTKIYNNGSLGLEEIISHSRNSRIHVDFVLRRLGHIIK